MLLHTYLLIVKSEETIIFNLRLKAPSKYFSFAYITRRCTNSNENLYAECKNGCHSDGRIREHNGRESERHYISRLKNAAKFSFQGKLP